MFSVVFMRLGSLFFNLLTSLKNGEKFSARGVSGPGRVDLGGHVHPILPKVVPEIDANLFSLEEGTGRSYRHKACRFPTMIP